jgi:hypothetical protein
MLFLKQIRLKHQFMNEELKFKRHVKFEGRNGYFSSIGLKITKFDKDNILNIYPITSKNNVARCLIEIPVEEIDDLIEILKKIK